MTKYYYYNDADSKDHLYYCNECGSFELSHPRNSEVDHRHYLQFNCLNCRNKPYFNGNIYDIIGSEE
jgi:hypothetical protein